MRCEVCGQDFLATHNCPGPLLPTDPDKSTAPEGFALFHYLGEGYRIIRWDDSAIRRVMNDPRVLPYGVLIWAAANIVPLLALLSYSPRTRMLLASSRIISGILALLVIGAVLALIQLGICHVIARSFFGGKGTFMQILRPLLLASIVYVLFAIPIAGVFVGSIAWVAVMMMVFQEAHGMQPLTAFLLSAVVGVVLRLLSGFFFKTPL